MPAPAWWSARSASSQIDAHLIGDGPDRASCEQLVHQAGLSDRIHFHGRVPPEQVQHERTVEAGYGAEQCFERWLGVIGQHQNAARLPAPIRTTDLRRLLPLADPRFQSQYPSPPSRWSRLQPRRMLGRLRRLTGQMA